MASKIDGQDQRDIVESTIGVLFFGTPHRGSDWAEAGKMAEHFTSILGFSTNSEGLRGLMPNNQVLTMLRDDFNRLLDNYSFSVTTYQETKGIIGISYNKLDALVSRTGSFCSIYLMRDRLWLRIPPGSTTRKKERFPWKRTTETCAGLRDQA